MKLKAGDIIETYYNGKNINHCKYHVRGKVDNQYVVISEKGNYRLMTEYEVKLCAKGDCLRVIGFEEVQC